MLRSSILSPRSSPSGRLPIINEGYSRRKSKVPTAKSRAELLNHALAELERVRRISTNTGHFLVGGGPQQAHLRKKRYQPCDTDFESQIVSNIPSRPACSLHADPCRAAVSSPCRVRRCPRRGAWVCRFVIDAVTRPFGPPASGTGADWTSAHGQEQAQMRVTRGVTSAFALSLPGDTHGPDGGSGLLLDERAGAAHGDVGSRLSWPVSDSHAPCEDGLSGA